MAKIIIDTALFTIDENGLIVAKGDALYEFTKEAEKEKDWKLAFDDFCYNLMCNNPIHYIDDTGNAQKHFQLGLTNAPAFFYGGIYKPEDIVVDFEDEYFGFEYLFYYPDYQVYDWMVELVQHGQVQFKVIKNTHLIEDEGLTEEVFQEILTQIEAGITEGEKWKLDPENGNDLIWVVEG